MLAIGGALVLPPIPQDPAYHDFADRRPCAGVPNFFNVTSNLPIFLVALYGVEVWRKAIWADPLHKWPWLAVCAGAAMIGVGSAYYHVNPNNQTLYWDRLPMTLAFMGVFSAAIAEFIHSRTGVKLLPWLLALGVVSVEVWRRSETAGAGDLRFYALVQFYPLAALLLILVLFESSYSHSGRLWLMAGLYVLAKVFEAADQWVFLLSREAISGHSLKHLASALALAAVFSMLPVRRIRQPGTPSFPPAPSKAAEDHPKPIQ